ncbi:hypothetical protein PAXRUDRAFT_62294, partial [Paxillus rubicundulus Ve08.2h10]
DWSHAYPHLIHLIHKYLPGPDTSCIANSWQIHHDHIASWVNFFSHFNLFLHYDIHICHNYVTCTDFLHTGTKMSGMKSLTTSALTPSSLLPLPPNPPPLPLSTIPFVPCMAALPSPLIMAPPCKALAPLKLANMFALPSMDAAATNQILTVPVSMPAPSVGDLTQLKSALDHSLLPIVTPFHWDCWKALLTKAGVLDCFADV